MNRNLIIIVLTATVLSACAHSPYPGGRIIWREEINSNALTGNLFGDSATRYASIYLPASYDTTQMRYPVLYVLQSFRLPLVDPLQISKALDQAIDAGQSREMIVVFIDGFNALGGSWYLSSQTVRDWDAFITRELVAHIESTYRTLARRDARAISGCSMGGYGALHLAFIHPDIYSVTAANSVPFSMWNDAGWEQAKTQFTQAPGDPAAVFHIASPLGAYISIAAATAPNPLKPPLYLDMPIAIVGGKPQVVPEIKAKIDAVSPQADLQRYLAQAVRLRALMIYHGSYDDPQFAQAFDKLLGQSGVKHQYLEVAASHCNLDWTPVLKFVSDSLTH